MMTIQPCVACGRSLWWPEGKADPICSSTNACRDLHKANKRIKELEGELKEMEVLFDLQHESDQRAIKRWQEATGRVLAWPDRTNLLVWLMERIQELEEEREAAKELCAIYFAIAEGAGLSAETIRAMRDQMIADKNETEDQCKRSDS